MKGLIDESINVLCSKEEVSSSVLAETFKILQNEVKLFGISRVQLQTLIDLITGNNNHSELTCLFIINEILIPHDTVSNDVVSSIVATFSCKEISTKIKKSLASWLISVYEFLENPQYLQQLFIILLMNLKNSDIRPLLCILLAFSANGSLIRPWMRKYLTDLVEQNNEEPELLYLNTIFQPNASPMYDRISLEPVFSYFINYQNHALVHNIRKLQQYKLKKHLVLSIPRGKFGDYIVGNHYVGTHGSSSVHHYPLLTNSLSTYLLSSDPSSSFIHFLLNPQLYLLDIYKLSKTELYQFNSWLLHQLSQFQNLSSELDYFLQYIEQLIMYTKVFPPSVEQFIYSMLATSFDGRSNNRIMFSLISYIPPLHSNNLDVWILRPLSSLFPDMTKQWRVRCFSCLTTLMARWANSSSMAQLGRPELAIIKFVNHFSMITFRDDHRDFFYQDSFLKFYESVSLGYCRGNLALLDLPMQLSYVLIFTLASSTLSRFSGILYKIFAAQISGENVDKKKGFTVESVGKLAFEIRDLFLCGNIFSPAITYSIVEGLSLSFLQLVHDFDPSVDSRLMISRSPLYVWIFQEKQQPIKTEIILKELDDRGYAGLFLLLNTLYIKKGMHIES